MTNIISPECPYCGAESVLVPGSSLRGNVRGNVYVCENYPKCDSYVSVYEKNNKPKGTLANRKLRKLRIKAHSLFDILWRSRSIRRTQAYFELSQELEIPISETHIAMFSRTRCEKAIRAIKTLLKKHNLL